MPRHLEADLQRQCVNVFNLFRPLERGLLFAVPNGGHRNPREAARLKAEGVVAGVADLIYLRPNSSPLLIEMKTQEGRQSDKQKEWQRLVTEAGYSYCVVHSVEEFMAAVGLDKAVNN